MCEFNPSNAGRRIDPCMRGEIKNLNQSGVKTLACCCGHGRYHKTIVIRFLSDFLPEHGYEIFSGTIIPRKKRFYDCDIFGYYFIPEIDKEKV